MASFHGRDGWYFERLEDGSVRIEKRDGERVAHHVELDAGTWASVVASVSRAGEHAGTFQMAQWVHDAMPHDWVFQREHLVRG